MDTIDYVYLPMIFMIGTGALWAIAISMGRAQRHWDKDEHEKGNQHALSALAIAGIAIIVMLLPVSTLVAILVSKH